MECDCMTIAGTYSIMPVIAHDDEGHKLSSPSFPHALNLTLCESGSYSLLLHSVWQN